MEKFDQKKYIEEFNKKNYVSIHLRLKTDEKKQLDLIMKQFGYKSYREFLIDCMKQFEQKK